MCIVYFFSFLDKSTLNYANAYGLTTDLGLKGNQYCESTYNVQHWARSRRTQF